MLRQPKLDVDSAGAWLLPWAKQQLARLKKLVRWGSREFDLPTGEKVRIQWGILDKIRIAAAVALGRKRFSTIAATNVDRFYVLQQGKLKKYSEVPFDAGLSSVLSVDGSTAAGTVPNTAVNVMRKNKATATATTETGYGVLPATASRLVVNQLPNLPEWRLLGGDTEDVAVSENGSLVVVRETASALPRFIQCTNDDTNTVLAVLASGYPQWVLDFYASRSIPHSLYRDIASHEDYVVGLTYALADISRLDTESRFTRITASTISTISLVAEQTSVRFYLAYDKFSDRPVLLVQMPFVTAFTSDGSVSPARYTATFGMRTELRAYDRSAGWLTIYAEQFDDVATLAWASDASFRNFVYDGVNSAIISEEQLHVIFSAGADWTKLPFEPHIAAASGTLGVLASYGTAAPFSMKLNGSALFTHPNASESALRFGGTGFLTEHRWYGPWGIVEMVPPAIDGIDWLSSDGVEFLRGREADGWTYWKDGALQQTISGPAPAANATTYATYGAVPASGFHFLNTMVSWRYDKNQFKGEVYTHIHFTPGSSGTDVFMHLYGGTAHIPTFGDIPVDQASGDGFNADATLLYLSNGDGTASSLSAADVDALFGVSGTTFELDGTSYDLNLGHSATPDSYVWVSATVDLGWDVASSALKVQQVYSDVPVAIASRGPFAETIPAVTTVSVSDSDLVQDYLAMTK